jgi:hypothetical protein
MRFKRWQYEPNPLLIYYVHRGHGKGCNQGCGPRIRLIFGSWIRIRIKVKILKH